MASASMKNSAKIFCTMLLSGATLASTAQLIETKDYSKVLNDYLIVASKNDYKEALSIARECAEKLKVAFHDRGAKLDTKYNELVYPKDTCDSLARNPERPCIIIRGLSWHNVCEADNGIYITIEESANYPGLDKGLFIVVLGSGEKGDADLRTMLPKAKKIIPDSYIKTMTLYEDGCGY